jgi:hypothetical protein
MSEGLSQTDGAQTIPRLTLRSGPVQAGAFWRNITSPIASGIAVVFVKWSHKRKNTQIEFATLYRYRAGTKGPVDRDAWEFDGSFRQSLGRVGVRMVSEFAPKEFELGPSFYIEGGPTLQVAKGTSLSANIGRRERVGAPDYSTFNGGLTHLVGRKLSLDARIYGTNHPERGMKYRTRFVVSARLVL